jgi:hypothetical protein
MFESLDERIMCENFAFEFVLLCFSIFVIFPCQVQWNILAKIMFMNNFRSLPTHVKSSLKSNLTTFIGLDLG